MKAILRFQLPATVGSDLAGVVLEVGHHVTRFKPGDAVLTSFVLVTCIFLFLTAPLFLVTKRLFVLLRKLDPNQPPVRKTRLVHWVGLLMNEIMNQISELVAILRRDKFVLALSAPLASFDAAESVACLQWVTDTCGVAFFKNKKEHARRATAMWMPFVVIMATRLHL